MIVTKNPEIGPIYKGLRRIQGALPGSIDQGHFAPEILDFLAMVAGLKPVCLLGRGGEPPQWIAAVAELAEKAGFRVIPGPLWDATPYGKFPDWYKDHTVAQLAPFTALYVCSSQDTVDEIAAVNRAGGRLSMSAEASLLGYPECCVVAHYDRAVRYHQAILAILRRLAGGRDDQMKALLRGGTELVPETPGEIAHMEAAFRIIPASYGSWNQCPYCVANDTGRSMALSRQYKSLAATIDLEWFRDLG